MAEKATQKVCIHTNVTTQINNMIKVIDRVYLIKPVEKNPEKTHSKPMNLDGWTCVGVAKDKHDVTNSKKSHVEVEYEIWINNKNLDVNSTLFKALQQKSIESNLEQDPDGRYQMVINFTTVPGSFSWDQNSSEEAEMTFTFLGDLYLDHYCDDEDCLINCEDFEEDIQYNKDGSLKYAYAKDHDGNIIFGIYDTKNN